MNSHKGTKIKDDLILAAQNKKVLKDFFILDRFETGIVLQGCEVKSIREHRLNLLDSYARIRNGELLLFNMHISPYSKTRIEDINPKRIRKLLMHRREINRLESKLVDKSLTIVPLRVYFRENLVKVEIGLAKGKTKRDKRQDMVKKEHEEEIKKALKKY